MFYKVHLWAGQEWKVFLWGPAAGGRESAGMLNGTRLANAPRLLSAREKSVLLLLAAGAVPRAWPWWYSILGSGIPLEFAAEL